MRHFIFLLFVGATFTSCSFMYNPNASNPYYYGMNKVEKQKFRKTNSLNRTDYTDNNIQYYKDRGYVVIGYCAYRDRYIGIQEAVNAGCAVGATVLLYKHTYVGTASGTAVLPWYTPGDTYTVNSRTSGSVSAYGSSSASVYGSNGYAYGNSYGSARGTYNSNTTTTVTGPGSFSYYAVPYSHDYYDQYAIFMVKKYYYVYSDATIYKQPNKKKPAGTLHAKGWFELLKKGGSFHKIKADGEVYYIDGNLSLY